MKTDKPFRKKESLLDTIISGLFTLLFLILFLKPSLLAIYQKGIAPIPMLLGSSAKTLMVGFLVFSLFAFVVSLITFTQKGQSKPLVWANVLSELSSALYFAFFMTRWDALNKEFIGFFRNDLGTWALIAKAAVVCFLLLSLISIADDLYSAYQHKKKS
ncbi:MAG TPA: hypothetical protein VJ869_05930 [Sphaerochaeta sp.]|nr:hypothetical protein [Sphaerochaeta sp.]